jgi:hypothetical protein
MSRPRLGLGVTLLFLVPVWNLPITGGEALNRERLKPFQTPRHTPPIEEKNPAALVRVSYCLGGTSGRNVLCLLPSVDQRRL